MHAASRHGTSSLTSLPKDGRVSCFWSFIQKVAHAASDRTQPSFNFSEANGTSWAAWPLTPFGSSVITLNSEWQWCTSKPIARGALFLHAPL